MHTINWKQEYILIVGIYCKKRNVCESSSFVSEEKLWFLNIVSTGLLFANAFEIAKFAKLRLIRLVINFFYTVVCM